MALSVGADPTVRVGGPLTGEAQAEFGWPLPLSRNGPFPGAQPVSTTPRFRVAGEGVTPAVAVPSAPLAPSLAPDYGLPRWQGSGCAVPPTLPAALPAYPVGVSPAVRPVPLYSLPTAPPPDAVPYYDPFTRQLAYGNTGFQPYYLGLYFYDEVTYLPTSPVKGVAGSFQDLQYNTWTRYARLVGDRHLFTFSGIWNTSWWTGPSGVNLPGSVDQLIGDFQISSLYTGPWNWQVGVAPQIGADFRRALDYNAYMVDGRFVLFYQASPEWRLAAGIEYWNRVHGVLIPYGGVLWAPNDRWEFRIFFPQTRISYYLGNLAGKDVWTYTSLGYQVNAWQVTIQDQEPIKTRMQMSDVQLLAGVSAAAGNWTAFAEGGLVFDRHVLFRYYAPPFSINDNLMARIGLLW